MINPLADLRLTLRLLGKAPGYTVATILTLALAIGANGAVFSAVYAVLLRPLPIHEPGRLIVGWGADTSHGLPIVELSYRVVESLARDTRTFSRMAAMGSTTWPSWLKGRGATERVASAGVSAAFFETLGAVPALGRTLRPEDDVPNAPRVAILSHDAWVKRFGADPGIVGTRVNFDDRMHTVIGVMPAGFDVPQGTAFWTAVAPIIAASAPRALEEVGVLYFVGRLAPGATLQTARDELEHIVDVQLAEVHASSPGPHLTLTPFIDHVVGPVRQALWALLAAVGILLLISCANVSGLMLTRVSLRRREHGIRLALGATPSAIGRLWITETLVLAAAGGILGFVASSWIVKTLVALAPDGVPRLADVAINVPVVVFSFVAVSATALLCGIGPVRQAAGVALVHDLSSEARATGTLHTRRLRSGLVVVQIGLSIVLLVAAALVVRSFMNLRRLNLGFSPSGVLVMNVSPETRKPVPSLWTDELLRRIRRLPRVEAAGAVSLRPLALGPIGQETGVLLEGQPPTREAVEQNPALNYEVATPGYFTAMRIALGRGRLFDDRDHARAPRVCIVSEGAATRLWPGQDPIGKRILIPAAVVNETAEVWRTVIGVVSNVRYRGLDDVRLDIYDAALQSAIQADTLVIRASADVLSLAATVQAEARQLEPHVIIDGITTMDAAVARATAPWRFSAWTLAVFATFAFVLAVVGLFSLVMLEVTHRRRELAIRLALGARDVDLLRSVLVPAGWRALGGTLLGVGAALAASRALQSLMFGISTVDRLTYGSVVLLVVAVVTIASYVPARKAVAVDPATLFTTE